MNTTNYWPDLLQHDRIENERKVLPFYTYLATHSTTSCSKLTSIEERSEDAPDLDTRKKPSKRHRSQSTAHLKLLNNLTPRKENKISVQDPHQTGDRYQYRRTHQRACDWWDLAQLFDEGHGGLLRRAVRESSRHVDGRGYPGRWHATWSRIQSINDDYRKSFINIVSTQQHMLHN